MLNPEKNFLKKKAILINQANYFTYNDILQNSEELKKWIKENTLVLLMIDNHPSLLLTYFSLLIMNCTILLIDSNTDKKILNDYLKNYRPQYIIKLSNIKINFKQYKIEKNFLSLSLLVQNNFNIFEINKNLKLLIPTSGTTGDLKFVKLTKENLLSNSKSISKYLNLSNKDFTITTMPASYSYGMSILNSHFLNHGTIYANNKTLFDKEFWEILYNNNISNINGVPYFYEILKKLKFEKLDKIKSLRFFTQAGGSLDQETFQSIKKYLKKNNLDFYMMYGQTEASPRISYCKINKKNINKFDAPSIGKPIPGVKIYLLNNSGKKVYKANIVGNIYFEGKNIFGGYAENFKQLKNINIIKKLKTGDLGFFDIKKNFYINGRSNRIVKLYGYRLNLDSIERKLSKIYKTNIYTLTYKNIIYLFSKKNIRLQSYFDIPLKHLKNVIIKKIPRLSNNKIDYKELEDFVKKNS